MKVQKDTLHIVIDIQKQLTKTLVIQAVIPLFTCCLPMMIMMFALILPVKIPEAFLSFLGLTLTYIPLGNALSILLYVKAYKRFAKNFVIRKFKCVLGKYDSTTISPLKNNISTKS